MVLLQALIALGVRALPEQFLVQLRSRTHVLLAKDVCWGHAGRTI
jgi:hypothetical protein